MRNAQVRLSPARLTHCMRWLGAARRAHDVAVDYARRRQAFGRAIGEHEGVGFMLNYNEIDLHTARLAIWHCAWVLDQGGLGLHESSRTKVMVSEALWRVVDRCVQILGGQGVTGDNRSAMASKPRRLAWLLLWVTPALWSSNYLIARTADGLVTPHVLALLRWSLALALMLPFTAPALLSAPRRWTAEWPQLLVLGGLGMWICGAFVYLGAQTTSALNIALIYAVAPVGIAIGGVALLHERMSASQRGGALLALAGVLYVLAKGEIGNLLAVRFTPGDLWIVAAALAWIAYSLLSQRWRSVLPPAARTAAVVAGGLVVLLPFTLVELWLVPQPPWNWRATLLVVLAAVLPGALSYTAYAVVQRELGASRTGLMLYLAPLYAALLAWALLGEPPRGHHLVGAALILPSIWLATRR